MKSTLSSTFGLALVASVSLVSSASAAVSIDWVSVGNTGNKGDEANTSRFGAVQYDYQIGKYEVTNAQYVEFLNAKAAADDYGLYNASMPNHGITRSGVAGNFSYNVTGALANRPVVLVSWFDAARFANWLVNGQGAGDTESGSYTLNGTSSAFVPANLDATIRLPNQDEWHKAAYFDPTKGGVGGYWLYPTKSDSISPAVANYMGGGLTYVGSYIDSPSAYGTFDQGGNASEWVDGVMSYVPLTVGVNGGMWDSIGGGADGGLGASANGAKYPGNESIYTGFRLASVPEPSCVVLTILASGVLVTRRKR